MITRFLITLISGGLFFSFAHANVNSENTKSGTEYFYQTIISTDKQPEVEYWSTIQAENFVEVKKPAYSKVWLKNNNKISFFTILNTKKVAIEYTSKDLQLTNQSNNWQVIQTLLPAGLYSNLIDANNKIDSTTFLTHSASVYRLQKDNNEITLMWLDKAQLPGKIVIKDLSTQQTIEETTLLTLNPVALSPIDKWLYEQQIHVYDYADIGESENEALLQELLRVAGNTEHTH